MERIAIEELRHASLGYQMVGILSKTDSERKSAVEVAVQLIRDIEPVESVETLKGKKQEFAVGLINKFAEDGDWMDAINVLTCESLSYAKS